MNILNLHAGRGGNRKLWSAEHQVTAVELDPELVRMYKEDFPYDEVIEGDADDYLLKNYKRFDFIWGSPPCPKNSRARFWSAKGNDAVSDEYPDLTLYKYEIFLKNWYKGKYWEDIIYGQTFLLEILNIPRLTAVVQPFRKWRKFTGFPLRTIKVSSERTKLLETVYIPKPENTFLIVR